LRRQPRAIGAEQFDELDETIVEHRRHVRGGASGLTRTDLECIDDLHIAAFAPKQIGRGHAGDAGADDADFALLSRLLCA
jgi:hypothetical protein